ncbi:Zn-ribbon domain-containing OB-fold protein [Hydrogenophaga sp.]|uniref:Zn-ribbon domain-containing OB-fold protein n=1 Tax=Hydrogenophaga sp. TaxID=1904254 RepID=UPI00262C3DF5|nr:Zn-ribbon domain-containing OB-fold protein [Hydrogenophaga sp.]MCW5654734.1 Zn-ribbon domain-containing OB-fold protein [Hydrogenophaga sp.]
MSQTNYQERPLSPVVKDAATEPYWQGAREGVLRIKRCTACGKVHFYPRALCPFCLGDTEWVQASGKGTIYSVSVARRVGPIPYALAYVQLEEGVAMLTNIVDGDLDRLRIGDPVELCFKEAEGGDKVPMFRPAT